MEHSLKSENDVKEEPEQFGEVQSVIESPGSSASSAREIITPTITSRPLSSTQSEGNGSKQVPNMAAGCDNSQTTPPLITVRPQPMAMVAPLLQSVDSRYSNMPSMLNIILDLEDTETTIPDSVTRPFLAQSGFETRDARLVRLCSLATQTLVRQILHSAKSSSEGQHLSLSAVEEELSRLRPNHQT